jgi:hypothetical protein
MNSEGEYLETGEEESAGGTIAPLARIPGGA